MPGTWDDRDRAADFADGSVLYGDAVLFCEEFGEAAQLVYRDGAV